MPARFRSHPFDRPTVVENMLLLAVAFVGGGILNAIGVPAGWMTGAMIGTAAVALVKPWQSAPATRLLDIGMLLAGTLIGSSATPEAIALASRYPASLAVLLVSTLAITVTGALLLQWLGGWRPLDAILASAPGALSALMAIAHERKANLADIAVIQFFRLFVLMAIIPSIMVLLGTGTVTVGGRSAAPVADLTDTAIMLLSGGAAGLLFRRLGVVAPMILGPTLTSITLHASGLVHGVLPIEVSIIGFVIMGSMVGTRVGGLNRKALRRLLPLAGAAFVATCVVGLFFAWPASWLAGVSYGTAFVAFAPGGIEAMAILAFALGLDPLYVGVHHLARFLSVGLCAPVFIAWFLPAPPSVDTFKLRPDTWFEGELDDSGPAPPPDQSVAPGN